MEFSLNEVELSLNSVNSGNSENLRNHWSMNWVQYKDLLCYLCLCGLVVSSLSLTQEILGSSPTLPFLYFINFFCHWIRWIQWKHLEKTPLYCNCSVPLSEGGTYLGLVLCVTVDCPEHGLFKAKIHNKIWAQTWWYLFCLNIFYWKKVDKLLSTYCMRCYTKDL